jgi:FAD synthase
VSDAYTAGFFDGVHRGHQRVLEALLAYDPAGRVYLFGFARDAVPAITSVERRIALLHEAGVTDVVVVDNELTQAAGVYVSGPRLRVRQPPTEIVRVPVVEGVSSERVRQLVAAGELTGAAGQLGRPFDVEGVVVHGAHRGRELGFPTANLDIPSGRLLPPRGIYAGATMGHAAAISIGVNPQFGGETLHVEAHLLDFDGDLYGDLLVVELWQRLRDELVFESVDALVEEIARDVENVRRVERPV